MTLTISWYSHIYFNVICNGAGEWSVTLAISGYSHIFLVLSVMVQACVPWIWLFLGIPIFIFSFICNGAGECFETLAISGYSHIYFQFYLWWCGRVFRDSSYSWVFPYLFLALSIFVRASSLQKHAYSCILKILPPKHENSQIKNSDIFHTSA